LRNTSSAMPDLESPNVPSLKARVHQRLSAAECAKIPLSALHFRQLRPEDFDEMIALHTEWFPVSYDKNFYTKSVQGDFFTLVASHIPQPNEHSGLNWEGSTTSSCTPVEEDLVGIITMSTNCEHHSDDIVQVLGADCASLCGGDSRVKDPLNPNNENGNASNQGILAYILTLGVCDGFRRRGLARELLRRSLEHVNTNMQQVHAVYLHVVTYNEAAIQLYESMKFLRIGHFSAFYFLHGKPYDSFLYALYVHNGRPPWKWRVMNFLGFGQTSTTWREFFMSAWNSLWSNYDDMEKPIEKPIGIEPP